MEGRGGTGLAAGTRQTEFVPCHRGSEKNCVYSRGGTGRLDEKENTREREREAEGDRERER